MKIGLLDIKQPIILAPMEDVSGVSFRVHAIKMGADIVYTEFTSSEAIIRNIPKALNKIKITDQERPIAIQIFGGTEDVMAKAVKIAEKFKPDFIDINCGCWSKTHVSRGEGAGLLKDLPKLERIVKSVTKATSLPVTVKTRLGWDNDNIVILDVAKIVEQAGASAIAVHCRTRCQGYKGKADWSWLSKIKKAVNIPLIGNGDITTCQDIKAVFDLGCDGVMIGRGAVANPWIFKQAKHFLSTGNLLPEPTLAEKIKLCIDHLKLSVLYRGPYHGTVTFRKYYSGYLKGLPYIGKLKSELMDSSDLNYIIDKLNEFLRRFEN